MKTRVLSIAIIVFLGITSVMAQDQAKEEFLVAGACGMCETRIEKAANRVEGVAEASWDKETKMLEVTFCCTKPDMKAIHKAVAEAGHDTKLVKAEDAVYDKLPGCCKYERLDYKKVK